MTALEPEYLIPLSPTDYAIMTALAERPLYGFALTDQCSIDSEGIISLGRGTLYPALKRLEKFGYIACVRQEPGQGSRHRRIYALTDRGRLVFEQETSRLRRAVHLAELRLRRKQQKMP